jgi:pimeloyl-ACP methyl ester carboxylesterase
MISGTGYSLVLLAGDHLARMPADEQTRVVALRGEGRSETTYVDVDGVQIAYRVIGGGPLDLVYFFGLGSHVDMYTEEEHARAWVAGLSSFSRLIIFDRRGTGLSDRLSPGTTPTWEEWAADLGAVLDAAGSDRAAILASSDAGPIATLFAASAPDRVSALILANTTARFLAADDYPIGRPQEVADSIAQLIQEQWGTRALASILTPETARDPAAAARMAARMRASVSPRAAADQLRYLLGSIDVRSILDLVCAPTLVLHNANNPLVPTDHGRYLADHIPGARYVELQSSASGLVDARGVALEEIAYFLTGGPAPADPDRILTTVLFTDIVGSTSRAACVGDTRWRATLDVHDATIRGLLAH